MNFVAIDFETANSSRSSVCSLAAVTVENGQIVRTAYSLIRPPVMKFDYRNIQIHGIKPEDVMNKPTFDQLWERICPHLENKIVLAHNAAFDISVLRNILQEYSLPMPRLKHACTVQIAKKAWPGGENYKLSTLAQRFRINFEHHNALHDARTCAKIVILAGQELKAESLAHLMQMLKLSVKDFI
ncbi:MAG: 3'-5' exonuclease [Sporomusaceae bacterium]|nr:3'-5' exonuclease [Sporomusaceae bacterium]